MSWRTQGKAPDYRFSLANERTYLAWIRTSLAFMAAAIGIDQLAFNMAPAWLRALLVVSLSLTAAMLAGYAWRRWASNERAMRNEAPLAYPPLLLWLSGGLAAIVLLTLAVRILQ